MNWTQRNYSKRTVIGHVLAVFLLLVMAPSVLAEPQTQSTDALSESEYRKRDLEIKNRAIDVEERKAWTSGLATSVPIVVALFALVGTIVAARRTLVANITAKAAELALEGEGPQEVINRAILLGELYKNLLPRDFVGRVKKLDAQNLGRIVKEAPWTSNLQKEVVTVLADHPKQRQQIIADYKIMFPGYAFLDQLAVASLEVAVCGGSPQSETAEQSPSTSAESSK